MIFFAIGGGIMEVMHLVRRLYGEVDNVECIIILENFNNNNNKQLLTSIGVTSYSLLYF